MSFAVANKSTNPIVSNNLFHQKKKVFLCVWAIHFPVFLWKIWKIEKLHCMNSFSDDKTINSIISSCDVPFRYTECLEAARYTQTISYVKKKYKYDGAIKYFIELEYRFKYNVCVCMLILCQMQQNTN